MSFYLIQALNAVQYGLLLFLVASGLTLIFGIMGVINLAHGSFYMIGAYLAYWLHLETGNLLLAVVIGLPLAVLLGLAVERLAIGFLYARDHLYQVLLTYGLILIFNELQRILWGNDPHGVPVPDALAGSVPLTETQSYPVYRLFISAACIAVAAGMYAVIHKTRLGMTIRAGAANREMVQVLGIDIGRLFAIVFSLGAALAAFSGMLSVPVSSVYPGMGEHVLIISFVVVVIGGIGSILGAFVGAMLIGFADTFGKVLVPEFASIAVYALMAAILLWRPQGLFGSRTA
ncbi:MAG TPA: branched-chain amino acid ABC transporter permease [Alphaproteobacteria bacterium]